MQSRLSPGLLERLEQGFFWAIALAWTGGFVLAVEIALLKLSY